MWEGQVDEGWGGVCLGNETCASMFSYLPAWYRGKVQEREQQHQNTSFLRRLQIHIQLFRCPHAQTCVKVTEQDDIVPIVRAMTCTMEVDTSTTHEDHVCFVFMEGDFATKKKNECFMRYSCMYVHNIQKA